MSSSSESDSDTEVKRKPTSKSPSTSPVPETNGDISMVDRDADSAEPETKDSEPAVKPIKETEDFASIYLRRIAAELGDDLDKVRGANDFTIRSVSMLVHALKQGASCFSAEEQAMVISAANT